MKIPKPDDERLEFVKEVTEKCLASRAQRRDDQTKNRSYFLFGSAPQDNPAHFNKIFPHIDQLTSFLYSAESTQFTIETGAGVHPNESKKIPGFKKKINDEWLNSNADQVFTTSLQWALAYNTTIIKLVVGKGNSLYPMMIDPGCFGVLREDLPYLDRQEAMVMTYYTTFSELRRRLDDHPSREDILARVTTVQQNLGENTNSSMERMIISSVSPQISGQAPMQFNGYNTYTPIVAEDVIEQRELWVWDDDANDYNVFTMADPQVVIFDRPSSELFLKGEHPFVQVCPNPLPDYFWGASEVERLIYLQDMRTKRVGEILTILAKQVNPPKSLIGYTGILDEKNFALSRAGGLLATSEPNVKVESLAPQMPEDLWREIREIDDMFSEASGITPVMSGRGESGVRSTGHASQLARLGSSRAKKRALVVEDALEKLATLYGKCLQKYDDTHLRDDEGNEFIAEQFTRDYIVKVDAHSNSPIFTEDTRDEAKFMLKAGIIDGDSYLDLIDPPQKDRLKEKFKIIQKKKAEAEQEKAQQEAKAKARPSGGSGVGGSSPAQQPGKTQQQAAQPGKQQGQAGGLLAKLFGG